MGPANGSFLWCRLEAGLLDRDEGGLHADYEAVKIRTRVAL